MLDEHLFRHTKAVTPRWEPTQGSDMIISAGGQAAILLTCFSLLDGQTSETVMYNVPRWAGFGMIMNGLPDIKTASVSR